MTPHKFALLRCPVCGADLDLVARTLQCPKRHSFDLAKTGYVNLLSGKGAAVAEGGDGPQQLARRDAFLAKGYFNAIADTIAPMVAGHLSPSHGPRTVLDAGCGTGHHLHRLTQALAQAGEQVTATGIDISKDAAAHAARRNPAMAFAVADLWQAWPVRDAAVDLLLNVFAPKNFPEAARVLRPGGTAALAYPGPDHLAELREAFNLIGQQEGKMETYAAGLAEHIAQPLHRRLRAQVLLDAEDVANAILMGPNAHWTAAGTLPPPSARPVTIDIELLIARKPL